VVVRLDLPVHVPPLRGRLEERLEGRARNRRVDVRLAADEADVELLRLLVVADELDARRLDRDHPGRLAAIGDAGIFASTHGWRTRSTAGSTSAPTTALAARPIIAA
jgi:hypothetical protein